jgi:hypothetical protein
LKDWRRKRKETGRKGKEKEKRGSERVNKCKIGMNLRQKGHMGFEKQCVATCERRKNFIFRRGGGGKKYPF